MKKIKAEFKPPFFLSGVLCPGTFPPNCGKILFRANTTEDSKKGDFEG
jgi:hypothetical protein